MTWDVWGVRQNGEHVHLATKYTEAAADARKEQEIKARKYERVYVTERVSQ